MDCGAKSRDLRLFCREERGQTHEKKLDGLFSDFFYPIFCLNFYNFDNSLAEDEEICLL